VSTEEDMAYELLEESRDFEGADIGDEVNLSTVLDVESLWLLLVLAPDLVMQKRCRRHGHATNLK
jgi:hypothetical protein